MFARLPMVEAVRYEARMAPREPLLRSLARKIPFVDSSLSLAQAVGLPGALLWLVTSAGTIAMMVWAFLTEALPGPVVALIGLGSAAFLLWLINGALSLFVRIRQAARFSKQDLLNLAAEAEKVSAQIMELYGRHSGGIQAAWWRMAENGARDHSEHSAAISTLVEAYSKHYAGEAWRIIHAAERLTIIPDDVIGDAWSVGRTSPSEQDVQVVAMFLSRLAAFLRYGER